MQFDYNMNILHTAEAQPVKGKGRARGEAPNGFDGSLKTSVRTIFVFHVQFFFLNECGSLYVESMRRHCNCLIICYVIILEYDHIGLCLKYMMKQSPL